MRQKVADPLQGIAVDADGNAYIMGQTNGADFYALNAVQPNFGGGLCVQDQSIEAIREFYAALSEFCDDVREALTSVQLESQRLAEWLSHASLGER